MNSRTGTSPAPATGRRAPRTAAQGNGVLFLLGALSDPVETFTRARGRRYWGTAAVLLAVVQMVELARVEAHPVVWVSYPVVLTLSLMVSYPLTALARWICRGPVWLTDATASQGVILTAAASFPASILFLLGVPGLTTFLVSLVLLVLAVVAQVALWSAAFSCRWWRAALAYLAVTAVTVAGAVVLVSLFAPSRP